MMVQISERSGEGLYLRKVEDWGRLIADHSDIGHVHRVAYAFCRVNFLFLNIPSTPNILLQKFKVL
jgi:hypothetical protein